MIFVSVRSSLSNATAHLAAVSDTPRLDAELLMAHALGTDRNSLLLRHLDEPEPEGFDALLTRRLNHEPLAYITRSRDFWTITLEVGPGVLIPRPDSETLIEAALEHFSKCAPRRILDLGTGPGTLLLAALSEWPDATGLGVDASPVALDYAGRNARRLGLDGRARFAAGDWGSGLGGRFDLILCNPPYVEDVLSTPGLQHEPAGALFAGPEGMDAYRRLIPQLAGLLAPGGCACIEIGHRQAGAVTRMLEQQGFTSALRRDLGGRDRCLVAQAHMPG